MKYLIKRLVFVSVFISIVMMQAIGEAKENLPCKGPYSGKRLNENHIQKVLMIHKEWLDAYEIDARQEHFNDERRANFCGANLDGVDLYNDDLTGAYLYHANLNNACQAT